MIYQVNEIDNAKSGILKCRMGMADMLDKVSLESALAGFDIVISSANGYMKENLKVDLIGNKNQIEVSKSHNIKKFIFKYCSLVLTSSFSLSCKTFFWTRIRFSKNVSLL